jgi:hypothetical protein
MNKYINKFNNIIIHVFINHAIEKMILLYKKYKNFDKYISKLALISR